MTGKPLSQAVLVWRPETPGSLVITHDIGDTLKQSVSEQAMGLAKDVGKGVSGTSKGKEAAGRVAKVYFHTGCIRYIRLNSGDCSTFMRRFSRGP